MEFIEEVVVEEFLPTYRSMLADALRDRGLTQSRVATLLGISQSAVSKYVHGEVERNERLLDNKPLQDLVANLAEGLASGEITRVQALVETEVFIRDLEQGGALATLHEAVEPELAEYESDFGVHDPDSELRQAERALSGVRQGLQVVENTSGFTTLIPAVGSNLVQATPDADGVDDVAGVPGRIVDVKGRATIPADPEFGVSAHVANVLLSARAAGSDALAALNIRYTQEYVKQFERDGFLTAEFDAAAERDGVDEALAATPDAEILYQTGGMGVEPNLYVLGRDAPAVAETVRRLV
jgi:predicted fused transcriptional regulator/phosphomethylpyrimidine kinase/predicted transcriptional regulator